MSRNAVVTGAGSGVGQATALALLAEGWGVALIGRRPDALETTRRRAEVGGGRCRCFACDISDAAAVATMAEAVLASFTTVDVLVNAAGTNAPRRAWEQLALADYHAMIDTNLNGAYYCVQAFLPHLRARQTGTIVNIVSEAGRAASPKAGPAYVMSKFGLAGLTQSLNAEERAHGIRACAIFPGDIDTPLLDKRPQPPSAEARARMLLSEDVAACALFCINLPPHAIVEELLLRPR